MRRRLTSAAPATGRALTDRLLWLIVAGWAVILAAFAIARHERLNSSAYDLAIKSQVIWNTYQGRWFASSIEVEHYLGDHVQLIFLLLAPLYALWADVKILLIVQAIILSLGAIPVYRIARRALDHRPLALVFAAAYLLYPTIGFVNRFDFHPLTFVIFFLLMAFDLLETDRPYWASLFILLALACREDVGFTVFALGLYVALVRQQRLLGTLWAVAGLAWSLAAIFIVIPHFRGAASDTLSRYGWLGDSPVAIVETLLTRPFHVLQTILSDPLRLQFLAKLLLPLGFLALLAPALLAIGLPALAYNLLSATPSQSSIYFQYVAPVIPFIFIAAIRGAVRLRRWLPPQAPWAGVIAGWIVVATAVAWLLDNPFTTVIDQPYYPVYALEQVSDGDAFRAARQLLPPDAPVATMMAYAPHLSLRPELHLFYDRLRLEERRHGFPQVDYALLNLSDLRWGVNARFFYAAIETAIGRYGYEAIYYHNDVVLLQRGVPPQPATGALLQRVIDLEEAGGKFAPAAPSTLDWMGRQWLTAAAPDTGLFQPIHFDAGIRLIGYQLLPATLGPGRPLCATLYWQPQAPVPTDYTVFVHLAGESGYVHAQRDTIPALGFHPTTKWQPGEIVADMHCLRLPLEPATGHYRLNIGLYDPNSGERLAIVDEIETPAPGAVHLATLNLTQP